MCVYIYVYIYGSGSISRNPVSIFSRSINPQSRLPSKPSIQIAEFPFMLTGNYACREILK